MADPATPLTRTWIERTYFFGFGNAGLLTDAKGDAFPDEPYIQALAMARSKVARRLGLPIGETQFLDERHDYRAAAAEEFSLMILDHGPLIEVQHARLYYNSEQIFELPNEWLRLDKGARRIQVIPTMAAAIPMQVASYMYLNNFFTSRYSSFPDFFSFDYTAGLDDDTDTLDPLIIDCIGKLAAAEILEQIGDLVGGAGMSSSSASVSGLSQSASYTKSGRSAFAARIERWKREADADLTMLRRDLLGIQLGVV